MYIFFYIIEDLYMDMTVVQAAEGLKPMNSLQAHRPGHTMGNQLFVVVVVVILIEGLRPVDPYVCYR